MMAVDRHTTYSDRRLFSGLAKAARIACRQRVSMAIAIIPMADNATIHQLMSIR